MTRRGIGESRPDGRYTSVALLQQLRERPGDLLRRGAALAVIAVTIPLAAHSVLYWLSYGADQLYRTDFGLYYAFSLTGLQSGWSHLYDLAAQQRAYATVGHDLWFFPLPYTPPMAWLAAPLTALPLIDAYWVWSALMAVAFVAAWWIGSPREPFLKVACLVGALAPELTGFTLGLGQVIPLQILSVVLCGWLIHRRQEWAAGVALVGIALHPQGFLLVPVTLVVAGYWRTVLAFAGAAGALVIASAVALGPAGVLSYVERIRLADAQPLEFFVAFPVDLPLQVPHRAALVVQAAVAALSVLAVLRHRRQGPELALAAGLVGSLLTTSFIHTDDLLLLAPAAWYTLRSGLRPWVVLFVLATLVAATHITYAEAPAFGRDLIVAELLWLAAVAVSRHAEPAAEALEEAGATPALVPVPVPVSAA